MNKKKVLIGCSISLGIFLLLIAVCGFFAYRYFILPLCSSRLEMPEELAEPGIILSSNFISKELFFQDSRLSVISDIVYGELDSSPGFEIGIASSKGAVFLDFDSKIKLVTLFNSPADHVDFFDVDSDGVYEFINRGSWCVDASLIDHQGNVVWTYGGTPGVDDMSAGDMDLDGVADFVVGFNGGGGVHLVDINGKKTWKQSDGNVWHVEFVDIDGDGKLEIIHSNAAGQLTVRDRQGNVINRTKPAPYFSDFSICRWPTQDDREYALLAEDDTIWLFDFNGKSIKQYSAPKCGSLGGARGIAFTIGKLSGYFAVIVNFSNWKKAILYIYTPQGQLEYQEILPEASAAIATVKLDSSGKDVLLIGGNGRVWKYSFKSIEKRSDNKVIESDHQKPHSRCSLRF